MLAIDRILVPTDLSSHAQRALQHAAVLASWHDADLTLLNVAGRHMYEYATMRDQFPMDSSDIDELLQGDIEGPQRMPSADELTIHQEQVEHASAAGVIVDHATEHDVDLVVMGTRGRRGTDRLLMGSVAEEVVRETPCPTMTVRKEGRDQPGEAIRRILVPVDFSEPSEQAVHHGRELAMTYGAKLDLLHVVEEVTVPAAYGTEPVEIRVPEAIEGSEKALAELVREKIGYEHVTVHAEPGHTPATILDCADELESDLIVIATHGRTGLERLLLGSVAEGVVRRASCPVFTVKSFGKSLLPSDAEAAPETAS